MDGIASWDARIHPETYTGPTPYFRPYPDKNGTRDRDLWQSVFVENEYQLGVLNPLDIVIDIGANIGSFSCLAYHKGSRDIKSYEPDVDACLSMVKNAKMISRRDNPVIDCHSLAVVGLGSPDVIAYDPGSMRVGYGDAIAKTITLDEIIDGKDIRFLKTDCEGYEWPILYTCKSLHKIQEIAGEYHEDAGATVVEIDPHLHKSAIFYHEITTLYAFLGSHGFAVTYTNPNHKGGLGNFWAKRK